MPHPTICRVGKWLLIACVLLTGNAHAVLYPNVYGAPKEVMRTTDWYRQCLRVKGLKPPPTDVPKRAMPERCNAAELYYDTQNNPDASHADWARVRECAFRSNASGVLMMLYANGSGVMPNLNLATKYACSIESPVNEMKSRVAHLNRKLSGNDSADVDVCDDVGGSDMRAQCASVRERRLEKKRNDQLAVLARHWSAKEQLGLEMVSKAAHYYAQHRADYETDQGTPGARAVALEILGNELDRFYDDIHDFEKGKVPRFSEAEFAAVESKLNETYQQFMQMRPVSASYLGTIRKSGVEKTQRAWLAYRDAMELFGSIRYPQVPASGWRTLLTSRRLRQLSELDNAAAGR